MVLNKTSLSAFFKFLNDSFNFRNCNFLKSYLYETANKLKIATSDQGKKPVRIAGM